MEAKFYVCPICGNVINKVVDSNVVPVCCGKPMEQLHPNKVDASHEKHVPVVNQEDDYSLTVRIGSEPHPMTESHHIKFVYLETENGGQIHYFTHEDKVAETKFCCTKDKPVAVYAYCNLHGLWKTDAVYERKRNFFCCRKP